MNYRTMSSSCWSFASLTAENLIAAILLVIDRAKLDSQGLQGIEADPARSSRSMR